MKKFITLILSVALLGFTQADTKFPRTTTFSPADLEKAKVAATAAKKSIAFIYTDKDSSCPLCQGAAAAFIDAVKAKSIIVFVNSEEKTAAMQLLPAAVQEAFRPGQYIPKVVVTDATSEKVVTSLNYENFKADERKSIRDFKKAL